MKLYRHPVVLLFLLSLLVQAQEFRATVTGQILDSSGASVANASVTARNLDTNEETRTTSNAQGGYTIPFLRPGNYTLSAEAAGFKRFNREGLNLQVGQTATVNMALEVGQMTEAVSVTAETPLLETAKADRGGVIDQERITELPLNGRNPFLLGAMVAGVNFHGAAIWQRPFDNGAIAEWTINGGQQRGTEFLLDGAPNNSQAGGNNIAYVPPVDSVQEFKIQTNTYDAQFGKSNGGIINVSLKSGTNAFHGTAYEFARRKNWDANTFQNNARGQERPAHSLDQYGFQVSGPVFVPKLFDGRNKLFFMINYEGYNETWPQQLTLSVPQPEMLQGDFSNLRNANGQQIVIYDPATGRDVNGVWTRDPFPGNRIPSQRISPIAQRVLGYMPTPANGRPGQDYSRDNLFIGDNSAVDDFYNLVFKFDFNLNNNNRLFYRDASNDRTENRDDNGLPNSPGQSGQLPFQRINDHKTLDWVSTLTPTFVFNLRVSFNRFIEKGNGRDNEDFDLTTLGFSPSVVNQLAVPNYFGRYEFREFTNGDTTRYVNLGRYFGGNTTNTWAVHPSATKIWGPHTLKFGFDARWTNYANTDIGNPLRFRVTQRFTQRQFNQADALSGNQIADFLIGAIDSGGSDYNALPYFTFPYYAPYLQDDWKVSRRLTMNLGLRWDINMPPTERFDRLNTGFDPVGGIQFAGVNGNSRRASRIDKNNIQPRIGAAYQISERIVARGGWGIYYVNPENDYLQYNGFSQTTPLVTSVDAGRTPVPGLLENPFPNRVQVPAGSAAGANTFLGRSGWSFFDQGFRVPYVHQFSAGFQFQLPASSVVEVSYVGSRTRDLQMRQEAFNDPPLEFRRQCNLLEGGRPSFCNELLPNPFKGRAGFEGTDRFTADTLSRWELARPLPQFGRITQRGRNDGAIWYNALQIQHQTRFKAGVNLLTSYTFSRQIEQWGWTDEIAEVKQRSLYFQDRPHRFTVTGVWQLPFGTGKRFLNTNHGLWGRLASGWELNSFFQMQSGRPWDLPGNVLYVKDAKLDIDDWKANRVRGVRPCVGRMDPDTGAISPQPYSVEYGCGAGDYNFIITPQYSPRLTPSRSSNIRLHTTPNVDASINKMTNITENVRVQFRAEAFNLTNSFFWGRENFVNDVNSRDFGSYFPANAWNGNGYPRQIQLAVKLIW